MQNIHFKVAANNSFRRFSLSNVTLASLKTQVASLFGINDLNDWSIKYRDEENQLVTISSDEELLFAIQLHGGKVLRLEISFSSVAEKQGNSSRHEGRRENHKARLAVRLNQKQERLRDRLASMNPEENPRCKAKASKIEATIASIAMELESLNLNDTNMPDTTARVQNASVELVTAIGANETEKDTKHTDRKFVNCNKVSCLVRKQEHVREKLAKLGEETDNPRKQAKIAKLKEKLAAITSKLEGMEKETPASSPIPMDLKGAEKPADPSTEIPKSEDPNKQLVQDVKSKFFLMKRDLHQDRMQVISLVKTLKALRIISRHGVSAGISLDVNQLAQTEVSLGIARDQMAARKLVIQQQKDLLALMKSQLGHGKNKKGKGKKDKEEKLKEKEDKKEKVKRGRIAKSEKWKLEKKLRDEKRQGKRHNRRGRRFGNKDVDNEDMEVSGSSSDSEKLEF